MYGFYATMLWYGYIYRNPKVLSASILIPSLFLLLILAADKALPLHTYFSETFVTYPFIHYSSRVIKLITLPLMLFLVVIILFWMNDFHLKSLGLTVKNQKIKPFIYILLGVIPFIVVASFDQEFLNYYPLYRVTLASEITNIPDYVFVGIYEFLYGFNLLTIELIFRGILVIGFIRWLGKGSIFPMVTVYCFIHFDKPILECISSILGGYALGVIALYTRSILGGTIIHIGMAWFMEIMAWIQKLPD
jgi:hypothetical protein